MEFTSTRFFFDTLDAAVEALIVVVEDARTTDRYYSFGPLSAEQVLASGLILIGELQDILPQIEQIEGTTRYDD